MELLDGKKIRDEILEDLKEKVSGKNLSLAVIQIGSDEASNVYVNQKEKMCNNLGIKFNHYTFDENDSEEDVEKLINELNNNDTTGILLQLPIPKKFDSEKLQNLISYKKDVDGLNNDNRVKLYNNEKCLVPCTPKGIMAILNYHNINVSGKYAVVVGRSTLVGKPIANLLLNSDASVTICHSHTSNLAEITKSADILIVAIGKKHLITEDMVKDGAIIIDVGINRVDGKLYGDTDFDNIKDKVSYITPVPGGVGPMTIASLAQNIYDAYLMQK